MIAAKRIVDLPGNQSGLSNGWKVTDMDFDQARQTMVDCQIRPNDVTDYEVIEAFLNVPREEFVPGASKALAYIDEDIKLPADNGDRYLMETMTLAKLVQTLKLDGDSIVLDVGCATGYSAAILSRIGASVVAVESDERLSSHATNTLVELGYDNAVVVEGALNAGNSKEGPYDAILVAGAVDEVPQDLLSQLKDGGRLAAVRGQGNAGEAILVTRDGDVFAERVMFNASVMPLPGFQKEAEFTF